MGRVPRTQYRAGMAVWLAIVCLVAGLLASACAVSPAAPGYGAKVRYSAGKPLVFPDLTLEYAGERRVESTQYPRGFVVHDFMARHDGQEARVSWSAGTGDIGPTLFDLAGRRYRLELDRSDALGSLRDGELVLWQDE